MSLFQRIFLWFWLAAVLLAGSFFLLGRFYGDQSIEQTRVRLIAQAEVVADIWRQGGQFNTVHWLFQQSSRQRPGLVDEQGQSPFKPFNRANPMDMEKGMDMMKGMQMRVHALEVPLSLPVRPGVQHHANGITSIIVPLPDTQPSLFLVQQIRPGQIQRIPVGGWLLVAIAVISLVSWLLARTLSRRIQHLRRMAQGMADGDLSSRATIAGADEVSALAGDFNRMADYVQSLLNSQRQLVSDVSHELRSPLARLRIALELAERAEHPQKSLKRIGQEADELENLVSELLSLARIDSGQMALEKSTVLLCPLLERIIVDANFEGEVQGKKVVLRHCDDTRIIGDPVLLRSALENVIRNALRYSPECAEVMVSLTISADQIMIQVDDQGPGVPEQSLEHLFEPFARIDKARDRNSGGFGLGLAITGRVLQAHGGRVWAENRSEGGLRIVISLPT